MPHKNSLLRKLQTDFPQFHFLPGKLFRWASSEQTIYYPTDKSFNDVDLLHELGHGLLNHSEYGQDIQLLQIERDAWQQAIELAPRYGTTILEDTIENAMDTYREWLYARSLCPQCKQTGIQTKTDTYQCLNCRCQWRANEARICQLRRYKVFV